MSQGISQIMFEGRFKMSPEGIFRRTFDEKGENLLELANFSARIINELHVSDGAEASIEFELEVILEGIQHWITITAEEFEACKWPLLYIGARAIVRAGYNIKDEVREAIQVFSQDAGLVSVYTHLGWIKVNGRWGYLHAGGIIWPDSSVENLRAGEYRIDQKSCPDKVFPSSCPKTPILRDNAQKISIRTRLSPQFAKYRLPEPFAGTELVEAIRITLRFLELGPDKVVMPLFVAPFRAAVNYVKYSLFIYGETGTFKSELLKLIVQFFGPDIDLDDLKGWNSTPNALAALRFIANNSVLGIDDYIPTGTRGDIMHANKMADDLLRSQANRAGKSRCKSNGAVYEGKPPRCFIICAGEMLPGGPSLNARYLAIEIQKGDIYDPNDPVIINKINMAQSDARNGYYAQTMAAYLKWIAPQYEEILASMEKQKQIFREIFYEEGLHARLVDIAADLLAGFEIFLDFAIENDAIDKAEFDSLWERFHDAMRAALKAHHHHLMSEDDAERYLELLASAMHCGRAHLKLLDPEEDPTLIVGSPTLWGYREKTIYGSCDADGNESEPKTVLEPRGVQIGWKITDSLYIDPKASLAVANSYARQIGIREIPPNTKTLGKRLVAKGVIVSHDKDRNTLKRNIEGVRCEVYNIFTQHFVDLHMPEEDYVTSIEEELKEERSDFAGRVAARERVLEIRRQQAEERRLLKLLESMNLILGR